MLEDVAAGDLVAVVNTHLFFHPNAPQVRALQVHLLLTEVQHALQGLPTSAVLFCGDLNAKPTNELYSFVRTGRLGSTALMWWKGRHFKWGKGDDFYDFLKSEEDRPVDHSDPVSGTYFCMDLAHPMPGLESIHVAVADSEPEYTNLVGGFEGVLDYIFFHPGRLEAIHALPVPPRAVVEQNTALPSPIFPSDHVAVVADLRLKAQGPAE
uniref:Endonuclease/exonuclease/phosphatase domain-containing protein n=1 Tax=Eutreptiella gymnastica TaxID=73025 RepID=A0A7S4LJ36_9EUGL